MTDYRTRECDKCTVMPVPMCAQCHAELLAHYRLWDAAYAEALEELRQARAELELRRQSGQQMTDTLAEMTEGAHRQEAMRKGICGANVLTEAEASVSLDNDPHMRTCYEGMDKNA